MIHDLHKKLISKELSARELTDSHLGTIAGKDLAIHAFLEVYEDDARRHADRIDAKIAKGESLGVLEGIPIALKDNILVEGKRTTAASKILEKYIASYDASVVSKLKTAGAIILGKTNLDEFAMGGSTENSAFGPTKNPHDLERVPGGSSGGSAAAVAAGMAPVALGSDTGGSIRQPAGFCGVVGFKPSYGRVSRSGLIAMASSFDQIGPFATSVEDAEIVFRAIEGKDSLDQTSTDIKEEVSDKKEFVIGVPEDFLKAGLDTRIRGAMEEAFKKAGSKGFRFEPIALPNAEYALACYYIIVPAEVSSNLSRFDGVRYGVRGDAANLFEGYKKTRAAGLGSEVKRRIALGAYVLSHGYYDAFYLTAQKVRTLVTGDFEKAFEKVDAIALPSSPALPFKFGEKLNDPLAMYLEDIYTVPVNLAGLPGITLPIGKVENLPVGMQLIGKRFADYALLRTAGAFEEAIA
ncbi:MAG: Asp-tRNA(Asn)/Glu-tRNA(Gln) amidotransferase subunit GatA [Patescibacteria group bacterium]